MEKSNIEIRLEKKEEHQKVENLVREVFGMCIVQDASFFLCKELIPGYLNGITGEYATPEGYFVDENECKNSKGKSNIYCGI